MAFLPFRIVMCGCKTHCIATPSGILRGISLQNFGDRFITLVAKWSPRYGVLFPGSQELIDQVKQLKVSTFRGHFLDQAAVKVERYIGFHSDKSSGLSCDKERSLFAIMVARISSAAASSIAFIRLARSSSVKIGLCMRMILLSVRVMVVIYFMFASLYHTEAAGGGLPGESLGHVR